MKRFLILSILLIAFAQDFCNAQTSLWKRKRQEFIFGAGASNFLGDLGGADQIGTNGLRDFNVFSIRPGFMIGYGYLLTRKTAIKTNFIYSFLAGDDNLTKEPFRNNRNCNFRTPLVEISSQFEYEIIHERPGHLYNLKNIRGRRYVKLTSYLFGGVGVIYFNPQGKWSGRWYDLRPLCTEGQGLIPARKKYSLFQVVMPLGIGFKFALSKDWSVSIELGFRKTFTDYIDDVSKTYFDPEKLQQEKGVLSVHFANPTNQSLPNWEDVTAPGQVRGDPTDKDSYMLTFISFHYNIPKGGGYTLPKFR